MLMFSHDFRELDELMDVAHKPLYAYIYIYIYNIYIGLNRTKKVSLQQQNYFVFLAVAKCYSTEKIYL